MADQFKCVRLSSEPENRERIKSFTNERNVHLEAYLKEEAQKNIGCRYMYLEM